MADIIHTTTSTRKPSTMKHILPVATLAFTALCASPSLADQPRGAYVSLDLGVAQTTGDDLGQFGTNQVNAPVNGYDYDSDANVVVGAAIGYAFGNGFSIEGELRHRHFDTDNGGEPTNPAGGLPGTTFAVETENSNFSLMANAAYALDLSHTSVPALRPFVKAGIGLSYLETETTLRSPAFAGFGVIGGTGCPADPTTVYCYPDNDDWYFAWGIGGGLAYDLTQNVSVDLEYRFSSIGDLESDLDPNGDIVRGGNVYTHDLTIGLAYRF